MRLSDMVGVLVRGTAVGGLQGVATTFHMCVVDITFQASRVLPSIVALRLYALRHVHVSRLCPVEHNISCDILRYEMPSSGYEACNCFIGRPSVCPSAIPFQLLVSKNTYTVDMRQIPIICFTTRGK